MPSDAIQHFVFVDYENVQNVDLGLVAELPVHVTLLVGKNQKKLETSLFREMLQLGNARVALVEVGASGRNALDITLAFYLGQAVQRAPDAQFCIVSKDTDYDPLLGHLHGRKIRATRHGSFAELPFLPRLKKPAAAAVPAKPSVDRRAKVIAQLKNPNTRNRPSSRKALLAHIKTGLGKESSDTKAEDIVRELLEDKTLATDPKGKVSYAG